MQAARRLWLDVGDLFWWPHDHVTGIQRAHASIIVELARRPPPGWRVRFSAITADKGFHRVPDAQALDRAQQLLGLPRTAPRRPAPPPARRRHYRLDVKLGKLLLRLLPAELRQPTRNFCYAGDALAAASLRWALRPLRRRLARPPERPERGDVLLNIGCSWINAAYNGVVRREQQRAGLTYALLLYDVNPYSVPQFHTAEAVKRFCDWAEDSVRVADALMTISRFSQGDLLRFMRERGLPEKRPAVIRLADDLAPGEGRGSGRADLAQVLATGNYLFTLSSIAPSKNHAVIVRAMLRLRERGRPLPLFVWGGTNVNTGHIDALLEAHPDLKERIVRTGILEEADLKRLVAGCRFTIFPSKFEGWSLPVAESLAFGKVCLASNAASIPEVGGPLVDYFDPDDDERLADLIERYLDDAALAARAAQIREGHRRTTWAETLGQMLAALPPPR